MSRSNARAGDEPARDGLTSELRERAEFESLVSELCASLAAAQEGDLDRTVDLCLERIGGFLHAERTFVARFNDDGERLAFTNRWVVGGVSAEGGLWELDLAKAVPSLPGLLERDGLLKAGPGLTGLPEEAADLREVLEREGVTSGVVVPLVARGEPIGLLGLDTVASPRDYSAAVIDRLRLVATVIGSTLERIGVERARQQALDESRQAEGALRRALAENQRLKKRLEADNLYLRDEIDRRYHQGDIVGTSAALQEMLEQARQVAETDSTVLILGETGTGKELLAHFVHRHSARRDRPLVKVNCGALPTTLIESELFGHERGAYTGALSRQVGRFEIADGATILLDEIGDLPLELQVKLLRVLESGEFERLGSPRTRKVDVRVLAATNCDLGQAVRERRFREDLFYRLNVFPITVPPLRERHEDIPELVWSFVGSFSRSMGRPVERISRRIMDTLMGYSWPGNVRELRNVVERAMITHGGPDLEISPPETGGAADQADEHVTHLDEVQRRHILAILERTRWRLRGKMGAAELLGMKPSTLEYRMKKLGIKRPS